MFTVALSGLREQNELFVPETLHSERVLEHGLPHHGNAVIGAFRDDFLEAFLDVGGFLLVVLAQYGEFVRGNPSGYGHVLQPRRNVEQHPKLALDHLRRFVVVQVHESEVPHDREYRRRLDEGGEYDAPDRKR